LKRGAASLFAAQNGGRGNFLRGSSPRACACPHHEGNGRFQHEGNFRTTSSFSLFFTGRRWPERPDERQPKKAGWMRGRPWQAHNGPSLHPEERLQGASRRTKAAPDSCGFISFVVRDGPAGLLTMKEMTASSMKKISEPPLPSPRSSRGEGGLKGRMRGRPCTQLCLKAASLRPSRMGAANGCRLVIIGVVRGTGLVWLDGGRVERTGTAFATIICAVRFKRVTFTIQIYLSSELFTKLQFYCKSLMRTNW
jgi:hypothetical protein